MRPAARLLALLLPVALLLTACGATPPTATPSVVPPTPMPASSDAPSPSAVPSVVPAPSEAPTGVPATPSAVPSPTPAPSPAMTDDEAALLRLLRFDAADHCAPRRTDLPEAALFAVECRPDDPLVDRVGIYAFKNANDAAWTYMNRMASYGVDVSAGDCGRDIPGDAPWTAGDGEGNWDDPGVFNFENAVLSPNRSGCFRDENGKANVRATCGTAYVGILGTGKDLSNLNDWAWRYPKGYEPGMPDRPGICVHDASSAQGVPGA